MAFFSKLRERLGRSSTKISSDLDDIVAEAPPEAAPEVAPAPAPVEHVVEPPAPIAAPAATPGLVGRLFGRSSQPEEPRRALDDAMLEDLEDMLVQADLGVDTALRVSANIAEGRMGRRVSSTELKELLATEIARILAPVARPLPIYAKKPQVVLVVGVNGAGKTTTIGKLASQFRAAGKTVVIAAGDTFRAAAVEQLQVWGDRAGRAGADRAQGSDPASLACDAMGQAQAEGADLLMIDTAGRLQNRADLMEELAKIVRVIRKKDPERAAQHAAGAGRDHRAERAEPGRDFPQAGRCVGPGDDQAGRHRAAAACWWRWPTSSACRSMPSAWASRSTIWTPSTRRTLPARWSDCPEPGALPRNLVRLNRLDR